MLTHPDFFHGKKQQQAVNNSNVGALARIVDAILNDPLFDIQNSAHAGTRSLTFYLKPTEDMPEPRRVKVATKDLYRSIREILEDYDVKLPSLPRGLQHSFTEKDAPKFNEFDVGTKEKIAVEDIAPFLETLSIERAELLSWRKEREKALMQVIDSTREKLGCDNIEIRYSCSAATNNATFKSLNSLLDSKKSDLNLPLGAWNNLALVMTFDDCTSEAVDAVEGEIKISPAQVALEWLEILTLVRESTTREAKLNRLKIEGLERSLSPDLTSLVQHIIMKELLRQGMPTKMVGAIRNGVQIRIERGKTCSKLAYSVFLSRLESVSTKDRLILGLRRSGRTTAGIGGFVVDYTSTVNEHEMREDGSTGRSTRDIGDNNSLLDASSLWLTQLPITMSVVVESGHGSKLLRNGDFRIDSRAVASKLIGEYGLLRESSFRALKTAAVTKLKHTTLNEKVDELVKLLSLQSLVKGVGVSDDQLLDFAVRVLAFISKNGDGAKKLKNLRGMDVRLGHRAGIDGTTVILPHRLLLGV
jgi:hypothetical protein